MNIGILGTGIGTYHIELFQLLKEVDHIIIFGRNEDKLKEIQEKYHVEITTDINKIFKDEKIDLVDICLPTEIHFSYILEALKHNKHVFCETPLSFSLEEIGEMKSAQEKYQKNVFVNLFIKFSMAHQILHDAITNNTYGKLIALSLARKTPALWGNLDLYHITTNLMCHEVDFLTWCFGKPNKMTTNGYSPKENTAYVLSQLEYDGLIVDLKGCSMMPDYHPFEVSYEAIFENGVLIFKDQETIYKEERILIEYTNNHQKEIPLSKDQSFQKTIAYVLTHLNQHDENILSLEDAYRTLSITLEMKKQLLV